MLRYTGLLSGFLCDWYVPVSKFISTSWKLRILKFVCIVTFNPNSLNCLIMTFLFLSISGLHMKIFVFFLFYQWHFKNNILCDCMITDKFSFDIPAMVLTNSIDLSRSSHVIDRQKLSMSNWMKEHLILLKMFLYHSTSVDLFLH